MIPDLLLGLLDDASLFPPASLAMPAAVAGHLRHRNAWYRDLTGPFVCPAGRLADLSAVLTAANIPAIDLSLIVSGGPAGIGRALDDVAADPRLRLRAVEVPADPGLDALSSVTQAARALDAAPLAAAAGYIELALPAFTDAQVAAVIDDRGYRAKLRTGGVTARSFPPEDLLAAVLIAVAGRPMAFKCTAGLHHPLRHTDPLTGQEQHGFLNVLLGTAAAAAGAGPGEVAGILAERDAGPVAGQVTELDHETAARCRALFTSFGTCSTDEPVADLTSLALISQH